MSKLIKSSLMFLLLLSGCVTLKEMSKGTSDTDVLWIENFDAGLPPNLLGGDYGAWDKDPKDKTQFCKMSFSADEKVGNEGYALKLEYDVDSPNPAYNGFWMKLQNVDFTPYTNLVVYMKGSKTIGCTDRVKLELKNSKGEVGKAMVMGINDTWQKFDIPFKNFRGLNDITSMTEFVVVFDDNNSKPKVGILYLDNLYVYKAKGDSKKK